MAERSIRELFGEWAQTVHDELASQLRSILGPLDSFLASLSAETGRWCAIALFAIAAVWVLTLKRDYVYRGAVDDKIWRDLRLWSVLALCPYAVIYLFFF